MSFSFPSATDPATLAQTLAEVASLINVYIASYKNAKGLTTVTQATVTSGNFVSQVTDATLIGQIQAGAQATLEAIEAEYTTDLEGLLAYIQLALSNNVVIPS